MPAEAGALSRPRLGCSGASTNGRSVLLPVLGSLAVAVVLLRPSMAVWHLVAGTVTEACAPDSIPARWPSWLPIG